MIIYQVFPTLLGPFTKWGAHLERAAAMGFDWIFVNPVQRPGGSGSLYSIADYFDLNPLLIDPTSGLAPTEQLAQMVARANELGLKVMVDLVINHTAYDSPLVAEHPEWYVSENGKIANPSAMEDGRQVFWRDLAKLDWKHTRDRAGLYEYFHGVVEWLMKLGFKGFRCDAAYQVPQDVWRGLIEQARREDPDVVFTAETLGNTPDQTVETAEAGFDYIFNSSKWWDFQSHWLIEQYNLTRATCPSISFPESHDTERVATEGKSPESTLRQRYLFAALFSGGVLMPIGYEFGFRRRLHVVETRSEHWESSQLDLTDFISRTNAVKRTYAVFQEDAPTHVLQHRQNDNILVLWKGSTTSRPREALIVLNKDPDRRNYFRVDRLRDLVQSGRPLVCVSPDNPMDHLPEPFEYDMRPGEGLVFVTER
ncbi:MAG TPA: alpha-amylase family glycosyl hydrolase [Polyangiaceae bacterium]|nr:alpha-amylase family glycosyl hydrolase [Polyangiaceae bacterium]